MLANDPWDKASSVLAKIGWFSNNIIRWISRNYPTNSRKRYAFLVNWACEVGGKRKKTFLTMSMNTAPRDKNAKRFALEFLWLIGHYTDEQLGLLDIFSTSNLPSVPSNPFLFKPHSYFVPTCIHYSNYVYKSTFNATPGYNVMMLLNLILLSTESYREFKCG